MITTEEIEAIPLDTIGELTVIVSSRDKRMRNIKKFISDKERNMQIEIEREYAKDKKNDELSNETKRKTKAAETLLLDDDYLRALDELDELEDVQIVESAKLGSLKRQFVIDHDPVYGSMLLNGIN